jgi:two-component system response regulator HydG
MMTDGDLIDIADLPQRVRTIQAAHHSADSQLLPLDKLERIHTLRVLDLVKGNKTKAAEILGISRATLYRVIGAD